MPILAKSTGSPRDPVPQGNHVARCFSIIEVGTVERVWEGKATKTYEIRIGFELPELMIDQEDGTKQPMTTYMTRNLTLGKNSRLKGELESWRGKPFTEEELKGFDVTRLLGVPAMLNVIHTPEGYDRVQSITPVPATFQASLIFQVHPTQCLSYDSWNQGTFDNLPDFLKEHIQATPEYRSKFGPRSGNAPPAQEATLPPAAAQAIGGQPAQTQPVIEQKIEQAPSDEPLPQEPPF